MTQGELEIKSNCDSAYLPNFNINMNNIWIVFHQSGWHVYTYHGKLLGIHGMMCDCKCHAMRLNVPWKRISNRSNDHEISIFNNVTGFDYEYENTPPEESNFY